MRNNHALDPHQEMLQINVKQKGFYESRLEASQGGSQTKERAANAPTNMWEWMRNNVKDIRKSMGVNEHTYALHQGWLCNLKGANVLDLGCFAGNHLSLWIAENCADYTAIDLSEQAFAVLDIMLLLSYTTSKNMNVMPKELHCVLKPGGIVISVDLLITEPLNRLTRKLYRPFQTDRKWEWPFTYSTFRYLQRYFDSAHIQGFMGMSKPGLLFQLMPGLRKWGPVIECWGIEIDNKYAHKVGLPLFLC